jgi:hypothetical protein
MGPPTSSAVLDPFACFGEDDICASSSGSNNGANTLDVENDVMTLKNSETARKLLEEYHISNEAPRKRVVPISSPNDFEVFDVPILEGGFMKGVRSTRSFHKGEEIMREAAILRVPNSQSAKNAYEAGLKHKNAIRRSFDGLHHDTQDAMMDLSSCDETEGIKTPQGIYDTNSFQLGQDERSGLFLTIARMNHSCRPSANHFWRPDLGLMLVFATRDIAVGEEICTMYGPSESLNTDGRRNYLYDRFSFCCMCTMCEEANVSGGDDRMIEIHILQEEIDLLAVSGEFDVALSAIQRCLKLMKVQGIGSGVHTKSLHHYGYEMSLLANDFAGSQRYLSEELLAIQESEGNDSPHALFVMQHAAEVAASSN